jgi:hypothetical protein
VVFQEHETGEVAWVQRLVHVPLVERYSSETPARPEPPVSAALPATVTVPVSGEPGSVVAAVGAVLSTRRFATVEVRV